MVTQQPALDAPASAWLDYYIAESWRMNRPSGTRWTRLEDARAMALGALLYAARQATRLRDDTAMARLEAATWVMDQLTASHAADRFVAEAA